MSITEIRVRVPGGEYPIRVGSGARGTLPRTLHEAAAASRYHIVTDAHVEREHGATLDGLLQGLAVPVGKSVVAPGEPSKSSETLATLWRELIRAGCDRRSCVIAFGGGVVGDLAGFAAATVLRGIRFVQVPTTLLAMVDASVGGKTGIDLPEGKNLVGAFHQPEAVVMDLDFLATLPEREVRAGWAEVIKSAAIRDAALFERLERRREDLLRRDPDELARAVVACVRIKAEVVEADERETGLRRILNFGHTVAHGLEAMAGYSEWLHGEAVSVGMVFAAELGERLGLTEPGTARRLRGCLDAYGLPTRPNPVSPDALLRTLEFDKKRGPGGIHWVLLRRLGETTVTQAVPADLLRDLLGELLADT